MATFDVVMGVEGVFDEFADRESLDGIADFAQAEILGGDGGAQFETVGGLVRVVGIAFEVALDDAAQDGEVVVVEVVMGADLFAAQRALEALARYVGVVATLAQVFGKFDVEATRIEFEEVAHDGRGVAAFGVDEAAHKAEVAGVGV